MNTLEGNAWQALAASKGIGPKALWQVADYLFYQGKTASWLLRNPEKAREALRGVKGEITLPDPDIQEKGEEEWPGEREIVILHPLHPSFPRRVKGSRDVLPLPALIYATGNLALLDKHSVSIVGARDAGPEALKTAEKLASQLAAKGIHVTSGYASGIDSAAHLGALRGKGTTTLVLAEGLDHFQLKPGFQGLLDDENALVLSQFTLSAKWAAFQAMARNKLVAALSRALVVVVAGAERDASGRMSGSFDAGVSALKLGLPVFVADPAFFPIAPEGNRELIQRGALSWSLNDGAMPILEALKIAAKKKIPEQKSFF